jgi:hypothetical protein
LFSAICLLGKGMLAVCLLMSVPGRAASPSYTGTVIRPVSITSSVAADANSAADYLISDNSGFTPAGLQDANGNAVVLSTGANLQTALATYAYRAGDGQFESWCSSSANPPPPSEHPVFTLDLTGDGNTDLRFLLLWQYGNNGGGANRDGNDTRDFSLIFHTEAEGDSFDFNSEAVEFSGTMDRPSGTTTEGNYAQLFLFNSVVNARYVALRIDNNYYGQPGVIAGGDRYGLGEIRFAIPEPSFTSAVLAVLGATAIGLRWAAEKRRGA